MIVEHPYIACVTMLSTGFIFGVVATFAFFVRAIDLARRDGRLTYRFPRDDDHGDITGIGA